MRLIDADALKEKISEAHFKTYGNAMKCIMEAPTVDAVPVVHGLWETANDGTHFCSNCGCDAPYTWDDIDRNFMDSADDVPDRISDYCYKCGAKMDGGNDE